MKRGTMTWSDARAGSVHGRRAMTAIEMITATSLLAMVMIFMMPLLLRVRQVDRATSRKAVALREARNLVERIRRGPSPRVPDLSEENDLRTVLPNANVDLRSEPVSDDPQTLRRTLTLSWDEPGHVRRSVELSWWTSAPTEDAP